MLKVENQGLELNEALPIVQSVGNFLSDSNKELDKRGLQKEAAVISIGLQKDNKTGEWQAAMGACGTMANIEKAAAAIFDHPQLGGLFRMVAAEKFLQFMGEEDEKEGAGGIIIGVHKSGAPE